MSLYQENREYRKERKGGKHVRCSVFGYFFLSFGNFCAVRVLFVVSPDH